MHNQAEIVARNGWAMFGTRHYIDKYNSHKYVVTIPGIVSPTPFTRKADAEAFVDQTILAIAREAS